MSHRRNQLRNDPPFAEEFKPAIILGGPRLEEMDNNVFVELQNERFNDCRDRLLYMDGPSQLNDETRDVFTLVTKDPSVKPIVHLVEAADVKENYDQAYVIEPENGATGIALVLLKETRNSHSEIYVNTYFLPFSTFSQIVVDPLSSPIRVNVKQDARVKLQVTVRPSATGEATFKTHDTEVRLPQTSEDDIDKLKTKLQFETAKEITHFVSQLLKFEPRAEITHQTHLHPQLFSASFIANSWWTRNRRTLLTVSVVGSLVTATIGAGIVIGGIATGGIGLIPVAAAVGATIGGTSGVIRGMVGTRTAAEEQRRIRAGNDVVRTGDIYSVVHFDGNQNPLQFGFIQLGPGI